MVEKALEYAEKGWEVFPLYWPIDADRCACRKECDNNGKHPLCKWKTDKTTNPTFIQRWWKVYPNANIGVATGAQSGFFVVDLDEGGTESLRQLIEKHGSFPATVTAITGSGGRHLFLKHPGHSIKGRIRIAPGIDIRGDGNYIVGVGSVHATGNRYEWHPLFKPGEVEIAEAPDWLLAMISAEGVHSEERERVNIISTLQGVSEGERDNTIWRLACKLRAEDFPYEIALDLVERAAQSCTPPLPLAVATEKVKRAYDVYTPNKDWTQAKEIFKRPTQEQAWANPIPLNQTDELPSFPLEVLPSWLRDFAEDTYNSLQIPADLAALTAITVIGFALSRKFRVQIRPDWSEPMNIYTVMSQMSGSRKSDMMDWALVPLIGYENYVAMTERAERTRNNAQHRIIKSMIEKMNKEILNVKADSERNRLVDEIVRLTLELEKYPFKEEPQFIATDVTSEALSSMLGQQGGKLGIFDAEGGIFGLIAGKYSNGDPNLDIYLKGHSGRDEVRVNRIGRSGEKLTKPALSMALAIQPTIIRGMMKRPNFQGTGFLARFLYSVPPDMVGYRDVDAPPRDDVIHNRYTSNVTRLFRIPEQHKADGTVDPYVLSFDPAATEFLTEFRRWAETELQEGKQMDKNSLLGGWGSKLAGNIARIIGNLHVAQHCQEVEPWLIPIGLSTTEKVCTLLAPYLIKHAKVAHDQMTRIESYDSAVRFVQWLKDAKCKTVTRSDIIVRTQTFNTTANVDGIISLLTDYGYIRPIDIYNRRINYEVNPILWQNAHPEC